MIKHLLVYSSIILSIQFFASAQNTISGYDRLDSQLKHWLSEPQSIAREHPEMHNRASLADPLIPLIFKSTSLNVGALVVKHGGHLHSSIGHIYTALLPLSQVIAFASEDGMVKIESSQSVQLSNETGRKIIGADLVHSGEVNKTPYQGKGVIVGVFDSGIDFTHPDFRKKGDSTQTRILSIWDQFATTGAKPKDFNYGAEWKKPRIDSAIMNDNLVPERDVDGHGTHVTGTAAGLRGIAPESDIISVKAKISPVSDSTYFMDSKAILDGVNYIYKQSGELGRPCVVNLSISYNLGSAHDGSGLIEEALDYFVSSRNAFIICVSAGNITGRKIHFGATLTEKPVWTYIPDLWSMTMYGVFASNLSDSTFIQISVDSAFFDENEDTLIGQKTLFQSQWLSLREIKESPTGISLSTKLATGDLAGSAQLVASMYDSTRTELRVYSQANAYNLYPVLTWLRIGFKGKGTFHSWWESFQVSNSSPVGLGQIDSLYKPSDDDYNMNILATGKKVLSVGAFVNKASYIDISGTQRWGANNRRDPANKWAPFSCIGPTTDGRIKPDFCAPGVNVASSWSHNAQYNAQAMADQKTIVLSGTSMSCPMTTGAVALYLERSPNATFEQVKDAIISTTDRDSLTNLYGALPNNRWGNGRLNIFKAMGGVTYVNEEQGEVNNSATVSVFPNPTASVVTLTLSAATGSEMLSVYDINGKTSIETLMKDSQNQLDVSALTKGIYTFQITGKGQRFSGKFVVE